MRPNRAYGSTPPHLPLYATPSTLRPGVGYHGGDGGIHPIAITGGASGMRTFRGPGASVAMPRRRPNPMGRVGGALLIIAPFALLALLSMAGD